jgi:hypothetical protein
VNVVFASAPWSTHYRYLSTIHTPTAGNPFSASRQNPTVTISLSGQWGALDGRTPAMSGTGGATSGDGAEGNPRRRSQPTPARLFGLTLEHPA